MILSYGREGSLAKDPMQNTVLGAKQMAIKVPDISQYTQNENRNGDDQRSFLEKLSLMMNPTLNINQEEESALRIKQTEPMMSAEELRNTNCQLILQQTQKELRTLLYRASKLVTCENMHGLLEKSEKYDIVEGTNQFVKVPIK